MTHSERACNADAVEGRHLAKSVLGQPRATAAGVLLILSVEFAHRAHSSGHALTLAA